MNLGRLLEHCYGALGYIRVKGIATGGSATTIVDSTLATKYATNIFNGNVAFITSTTDGLSPQGKFGIVSAYSASTWTITIPTVTDTVDAGDIYSICKVTIPLYEMIAAVNVGLASLPSVPRVDTSLTTLASTLKYTLPAAVKNYPIQRVQIGSDTYGWYDVTSWDVIPAAAGSAESLIFLSQPSYDSSTPANYTIKITYLAKNPTLSVYSDYVDERYSDILVLKACQLACLQYQMDKKHQNQNKQYLSMLQRFQTEYQEAVMLNPVRVDPAIAKTKFTFSTLAGL